MKIYTKAGDEGETSLVGGHRVSKSDERLEAYGTIDELNSILGLLTTDIATLAPTPQLKAAAVLLEQIQNALFTVGSRLACDESKIRDKLPVLQEQTVRDLEKAIDEYQAQLPALSEFILPGGTRVAGLAHLARTVCRRAERATVRLQSSSLPPEPLLVRYVNRLSDYLFVLARALNFWMGGTETKWKK